jgi:serine protease
VRFAALAIVAVLSGCNSLLGITDPSAAAPTDGMGSDMGGSDGSDAGPNQKPAVSITTPANGTTVASLVTVAANATDADGTIANVKFDLPDGSTITDTTPPYSTTWNSMTVADGNGRQITATATDNEGATATSMATFRVQNLSCIDGTFNAAGLPLAIPDNNTTGIESTNAVAGNGNVGTLSLSLHITHTFSGDLIVTLVAPGGASFPVRNRQGGATPDIVIVDQAIATFNGMPAAGTWKLQVADAAASDVGTLDSWSLKIVGVCQ